MAGRKVEEFDQVTVLEHAERFGVGSSRHWRDFCRAQHGAFEQRGLELALQLATRPLLADRPTQVELALLRAFALAENDEVMGPG